MRSPATNSATAVVNGSVVPCRSHHAPTATMPMTLVARVPANATAYNAAPSRSALTSGMTVVTASDCVAARNTMATAPSVTQMCSGAQIPAARAGSGVLTPARGPRCASRRR